MAKRIIHVIDTLGIGGAEILLLNTVNSLGSNFENIIVYLNEPNVLGADFENAQLICLDYKGLKSMPAAVGKLRRLIKQHNPDLVHAHLFWSTFLTRLACPPHIRFLFSVHSILSLDAFKPNPKSKFLEKLTYSSRQEVIFVSETARSDYERAIGLKGKNYLLYNFIADNFFTDRIYANEFNHKPLKLVAIGNLKEAKNYPFLIRTFSLLRNREVSLDIYGEGPLRLELQTLIDKHQLKNVKLKGQAKNIPSILRQYDIFVLASKHEGFGLAVVEAMACGLPCFLSDLPVFREITHGKAIFFDPGNENDLVKQLLDAVQETKHLKELSREGFEQAKLFRKENYIKKLIDIYDGERLDSHLAS